MNYNSDIKYLFNRIKKLGTTNTLLHITAHPDDEDIGLLAYFSKKYNINSYVWSATRGEGGQNRVNHYKKDELGIYRTFESINVRNIDGAKSLFGPFIDFGYSKNSIETFKKWGCDNVIKEIVRVIRITRADVVVSRWDGSSNDMHGHHQAIGDATLKAFELASNPEKFPDLLDEGVLPWLPKKLYVSTDNMSPNTPAGEWGNLKGKYNSNLDKNDVACINTGEFSFFEGKTYQEIAWLAYNSHQTQGMSVLPSKGNFYYYFKLIKSLIPSDKETYMFDGINSSLSHLGDIIDNEELKSVLIQVTKCINDSLSVFSSNNPYETGQRLIIGLNLLKKVVENYKEKNKSNNEQFVYNFLKEKITDFYCVISDCLGIKLEGFCTLQKVTPGESSWVSGHLWNYSGLNITNIEFEIECPEMWAVEPMGIIKSDEQKIHIQDTYEVFIAPESELSKTKWLNKSDANKYMYNVPADYNILKPFDSSLLFIKCKFQIDNTSFILRSKVYNRKSFPGGYRELPLMVVPPMSLHPNEDKRYILKNSNMPSFNLRVNVRCNDDERPAEGELKLSVPVGWEVKPTNYYVKLNPGGDAKTYDFEVKIPSDMFEGEYVIKYIMRCRDRDYDMVLSPVRLSAPGFNDPNNPETCVKEELILTPAIVKIYNCDAQFNDKIKYAYIKGITESMPEILIQSGLKMTFLDDNDLQYSDLNSFDTIIVGPNAYLVRAVLKENNHRILDFIKKGGTLIVQYQGYGYQKTSLAPYSFSYSSPHDRVTDEKSSVTILNPNDPLFTYPNKIQPSDFDNWTHDRGMYFWGKWDKRYETFLSCADSEENQKLGGLLRCQYGEGNYIYTGYSFFRQLDAGVSGAFRLFLNILSTVKEPKK